MVVRINKVHTVRFCMATIVRQFLMGVVGVFAYQNCVFAGKGSHRINRSCDLCDVLMTSELFI